MHSPWVQLRQGLTLNLKIKLQISLQMKDQSPQTVYSRLNIPPQLGLYYLQCCNASQTLTKPMFPVRQMYADAINFTISTILPKLYAPHSC